MFKTEKKIYLRKIGELNNTILEELKDGLNHIFKKFNLSVKILKEKMPLKQSDYDKGRKQYYADPILQRLFQYSFKKQFFRTVGIMDVDIYSGDLNFVFGIANAPRNKLLKFYGSCIISVNRLRQDFYNYERDKELFKSRVLKEAVHELGHTFGLTHCDNYCIMKFSNHLGETDQKPVEFCDSCLSKLSNFLGDRNFKS